jgi:CO/xanthine dehydrogenase Mo-binding subunit
MAEYRVIGKDLPRKDSIEKVTGKALYSFDVSLPDMLYAKILRSVYSHARIVNIDTSEAEKLPGVKAVITGKETWGIRFGFVDTPRYPAEQPVMAEDKVRYIGESVAAVAAIDEDIANQALDLIEVEYEALPAVYDPEEAMNEGAPQIHGEQVPAPGRKCAWQDWGVARAARSFNPVNNIGATVNIGYGDAEKGFSEADYIREDTFVIPRTNHTCMEPHGAVANYNPFTGYLDIWLSHMGYEVKRYWISKTLGISIGKIRGHKVFVGGAFGGKAQAFDYEIIAALLSRKTGRPVKLFLARDEVFTSTNNSVALKINVKKGVKKDGTIMAQHVKLIGDMGAYRGSVPVCLFLCHSMRDAIYDIPNLGHEGVGVYTNKSTTMSKRGHGSQQMTTAIEAQMDWIAEDLGLDPAEFRLKNLRNKGDILPNRDRLNSYGLPDCIKKVVEASKWKEKRGQLGSGRGIGLAVSSMFNGSGYWPFTCASIIKMNHDGTVTLYNAQVEFGQGPTTTMCQLVAEELGLEVEDVNLVDGDSELCPVDYNNWLSGGMFVSCKSALRAAQDLKQQLLKVAAEMLEEDAEALEVMGRRVYIKSDLQEGVTFDEILRYSIQKHDGDPLIGKGFNKAVPEIEFYPSLSKGSGRWTDAYSFTAAVAEVSVDEETGRTKVDHIWVADDCGREINTAICQGQLQGQSVMGIGDALFEDVMFSEGRTVNANFVDYEIPRALDVPQITTIDASDPDPNGPFGGKEIGECARAAVIGSIVNAVYDATKIKVMSLPLHPQKIFRGLREKTKA